MIAAFVFLSLFAYTPGNSDMAARVRQYGWVGLSLTVGLAGVCFIIQQPWEVHYVSSPDGNARFSWAAWVFNAIIWAGPQLTGIILLLVAYKMLRFASVPQSRGWRL